MMRVVENRREVLRSGRCGTVDQVDLPWSFDQVSILI